MDYKISQKKGNDLIFERLKVWRDELISNKLNDPNEQSPKVVVECILRYSLLEYQGQSITLDTYEKDKSIFDNIKLKINDVILSDFADAFLKEHSYFLGNDDKDTSDLNDEDIEVIASESNSIKKLFKAWCIHHNKNKEWVKQNLGISGVFSNYAIDKVRKQNKIAEAEIVNIDATRITKISEVIKVQFSTLMEQQRLSNKILEAQLNHNKSESEKARVSSNKAIHLSILAIILTIISGVIQILESESTTREIINFKHNVLSDTIKIKSTNLEYQKIMIKELNDLNNAIKDLKIKGEMKK